MPYEIAFTKPIQITDRSRYINDCCVGGDNVADALLPTLRGRYGALVATEEDWGWFVWFDQGHVRLAVDIFCDNPDKGEFRVHLTSRTKGLFRSKVMDTPELEELNGLVITSLGTWVGHDLAVARLDASHMPVDSKGEA